MTTERAGSVVGPTDWIDNEGMRMALALERIALSTERIAIALEQAALEYVAKDAAQTFTRMTGHELPPDQLPPPPVSVAPSGPSAAFRESRDLPAQPFMPMQPNWQAGMVHQNGHKPLKVNSRGLFCPTKLDNGEFCNWKAGR